MTGRRFLPSALVLLLGISAACSDSSGPGEAASLTAVSGGDDHACLLLASGALHCWGWGGLGQLGPGDTLDYNVPIKVTGSLRFKAVSAGSAHTCALTDNGTAYCWGGNAVGALGEPAAVFKSTVPVKVTGGIRFRNISSGTGRTCGVSLNGTGYCWGSGDVGELGNGTFDDEFAPVPVSGSLQFSQISTSLLHTCGVTPSGAAYCWGNNLYGGLGDGTVDGSTTPVPVLGGIRFASIGTGNYFSCGLTEIGQVYCWGSNVSFELGNGSSSTVFVTEPVALFGFLRFERIAVGSYHSCGLTTTRDLYCWGANTYGKLGNGLENATTIPVQVTGDHNFTDVTGGDNHTCALTRSEAFCWGWNRLGQLGIGSRSSKLEPVRVTQSYLE